MEGALEDPKRDKFLAEDPMAQQVQVVPMSARFADRFGCLSTENDQWEIPRLPVVVLRTFCILSTIAYTVFPSSVYLPPFPIGIVLVISEA